MALPSSQRIVERLVEEHYQSLYRYAYRLTGSAADAEDLTQEAFCKAQLKLEQLRDPTRAKTWLFSIARNSYLHRLRSARRQRVVSLDDMDEVSEPPPEPLPPVEPGQLQEALTDLDEAFRTPLILYYFEEFTYREIAEQMDLPIGTVMSRLARAKAYLRNRLLQPPPVAAANGPRRESDGL